MKEDEHSLHSDHFDHSEHSDHSEHDEHEHDETEPVPEQATLEIPATKSTRKRSARYRASISRRAGAAWGIVREYANNSTIHGIRYLAEKQRPITERIWWAIVLIICIGLCGKMIYNIYKKWEEEPVIVSFAEKPTAIWDIPFPAVTICVPIKIKKNSIFELKDLDEAVHLFKEIYIDKIDPANRTIERNFTDLDRMLVSYYEAASHIININSSTPFRFNFGKYSGNEYFRNLRDISPRLLDIRYNCSFTSVMSCRRFVTEIMTEDGICSTFNFLHINEIFIGNMLTNQKQLDPEPVGKTKRRQRFWDYDNGYSNKPWEDAYPLRVSKIEPYDLSITFELPEQSFDNNYYLFPKDKFKVVLHSPAEFPQISAYAIKVPFDKVAEILVYPKMLTTSESLKTYSPQRRQCFFTGERPLQFFRLYTQRNCELECLAKFTYKECGCVKFTMPHDARIPICGIDKIQCYITVKRKFNEMLFLHNENKHIKDCNCLPSCQSIQYKYDMILTEFETKIKKKRRASVSVTYRKDEFVSSRRSERYGMTDFLANFGGLLGLFMGVSILSFMEIIYYFTLRFMCNLGMKWRKNRLRKKIKDNDIPPQENGTLESKV